jgi:hypothetical protein
MQMSDKGTSSPPPISRPKKEKKDERKPHFTAGAGHEDASNHPARVHIKKPAPHHRYLRGYKRSTRKSHGHPHEAKK